MTRTAEDELSRMREVNIGLRRKLESARRDALLYAASFCEDNEMALARGKYVCLPAQAGRSYIHSGDGYAAKLREIAG